MLAVNPTAGRGRGARAGTAAASALVAAGLRVESLAAGDGPGLRAAVTACLATGPDALVVVGGDGMVNLGVNATADTGLPLGIVAAGTGNDIARALGLPIDSPDAAAELMAECLATGRQRRVDAVRCEPAGAGGGAGGGAGADAGGRGRPQWFAGVLGAGFDAIVNERANGWSWPRGPIRYDLAIARELPVFHPRRYVLELDGERWETAAMLVALANCPAYGGGMRVCPDARPDDGLIDVLVLEPMSRLAFLRLFPRVYSGTHVRARQVVIRRARQVSVAAEGIVAYGDGERLAPLPLSCEAIPGALRLLAADDAGEGPAR